jgi:FKBP-type peptidyl-prolyl cis-trans isomerase
VLEKGTGDRKAISGDVVAVNYVGKLEDGTVFDTNASVTQPFRFGVGTSRVISGFSTGVIGMVVGEKRRVTIPSYFGYGDKPRPGIPANSTLIFELQCVAVEDGLVMRTLQEGTGPVIRDGQIGVFALRIELLTGKVVLDTQFSKPMTIALTSQLDPAGLYFLARGMHVGEVRQAVLKPEMGFAPGKAWFNQALNVTLDLTAIEPAKK